MLSIWYAKKSAAQRLLQTKQNFRMLSCNDPFWFQEGTKREQDYRKQSVDAARNYEEEAVRMGVAVPQAKLRPQLLSLADSLPRFFETVTDDCRQLNEVRLFYLNFRQYILNK